MVTPSTPTKPRGNPGPAAFAYVIRRDGAPPIEESGCLGRATNNQAEYTALVRALEHAVRLGTGQAVAIHSDSELMVKQMRGEYRVKNEDLRELYEQAQKLSACFPSVTFRHIRREQNTRADQLCNEALDGEGRPAAKSIASGKRGQTPAKVPSTPSRLMDCVREEIVTCLGAAAMAWSRGDPVDPDPIQVWEQLWSILEENGVVRRVKP